MRNRRRRGPERSVNWPTQFWAGVPQPSPESRRPGSESRQLPKRSGDVALWCLAEVGVAEEPGNIVEFTVLPSRATCTSCLIPWQRTTRLRI